MKLLGLAGSVASVVALLLFFAGTVDGRKTADALYPLPTVLSLASVCGVITFVFLQERRRRLETQRREQALRAATSAASPPARTWLLHSLQDFSAREGGQWLFLPGRPVHGIERTLREAWATLDAQYGEPSKSPEFRLEFRLTFMTTSYRDGCITVAAWANQKQQRPPSLQKRAADPRTYDNSVTARIYAMAEPAGVISSDAAARRYKRHFRIYPEEPRIIRSHMAWPVLSPDSELLGTFVVDCNLAGFFRDVERERWQSWCEPFIEVIALEKLRLDRAYAPTESGWEGPNPRSWSDPPF